ncbi:MAG: chromosomal replication initiator protein DnaA [Patescibacteria group bacterium]
MGEMETLWKTVLGELELACSPASYKTFFIPSFVSKIEENIVTIWCPTPVAQDRLESRFYTQIQKSAEKYLSKKVELVFVSGPRQIKERPFEISNMGPLFANTSKKSQSNLYSDYTFETFVVGSNNKLAHAVATTICDNPGKTYNPFFIYSNVGLGKTHLAQAIGNEILNRYPNKKVIYTTGESFTNELIDAIKSGSRENTTAMFRKKYRQVDVLIVDDVQFIAGREATQEEFFHTFNAIYLDKKQVIVTSDRPPHEIEKLAPRISSRLASGIMVDMQFPDLDTRSAILRRKRDAMAVSVPNEVLDFVAQTVTSNIRELEGAFMQVVLKSKVSPNPITIDDAREALKIAREEKKAKNLSMSEIINAVSAFYNLRAKDLIGQSRLANIVRGRQVAMYLIRTEVGTSLMGVGGMLGGRDHSTIIHGEKKIEGLLRIDQKIQEEVASIKGNLGI